jgi:hypothetical protein
LHAFETEIPKKHFPSVNVSLAGCERILDSGRIFLIQDERLDRTLEMVKGLARSGKDVLSISRFHPNIMAERLPVPTVVNIWLSERDGPENISPDNLTKLRHRIHKFTEKHNSTVIVLDGLEYLALFNDFRRLNIFYEELNDIAMSTKAIVLIPIDIRLLERSDIARLRRFAEILEP